MTAGIFGARKRRKGKKVKGEIGKAHKRLFPKKAEANEQEPSRGLWLARKRLRNWQRTPPYRRGPFPLDLVEIAKREGYAIPA